MITVLKTLRIQCDGCGATQDYQSTVDYEPPHGWARTSIGPCGMYDSFRDGHLCPDCVKAKGNAR